VVCAPALRICDSCNEVLEDNVDAVFATVDEAGLRAALVVHDPSRYPSRAQQPGKLRRRSLVLLGIVAVGVAYMVISVREHFGADDRSFLLELVAFLTTFGAAFVLAASLFIDLFTPAVNGRATPERAVKAHLAALRAGRWQAAQMCLSTCLPGTPASVSELAEQVRSFLIAAGRPHLVLAGVRVRRVGGDRLISRLVVEVRLSERRPARTMDFFFHGFALVGELQHRGSFYAQFDVLAHLHAGQYWVVGPGLPATGMRVSSSRVIGRGSKHA